jgi:hypothetical protein
VRCRTCWTRSVRLIGHPERPCYLPRRSAPDRQSDGVTGVTGVTRSRTHGRLQGRTRLTPPHAHGGRVFSTAPTSAIDRSARVERADESRHNVDTIDTSTRACERASSRADLAICTISSRHARCSSSGNCDDSNTPTRTWRNPEHSATRQRTSACLRRALVDARGCIHASDRCQQVPPGSSATRGRALLLTPCGAGYPCLPNARRVNAATSVISTTRPITASKAPTSACGSPTKNVDGKNPRP